MQRESPVLVSGKKWHNKMADEVTAERVHDVRLY